MGRTNVDEKQHANPDCRKLFEKGFAVATLRELGFTTEQLHAAGLLRSVQRYIDRVKWCTDETAELVRALVCTCDEKMMMLPTGVVAVSTIMAVHRAWPSKMCLVGWIDDRAGRIWVGGCKH